MSPGVELGLVALGGAVGGVARFSLSGMIAERVGETFPWGTMAVNVSGAFLIGVLAGSLFLPQSASPQVRGGALWLFLAVGVLGSYTTVSSFSLQTLELARRGEWGRAGLNILLSFALCLGGAGLGYGVAGILPGLRGNG